MRKLIILFAAACLLTACDKDKEADYIAQYFFGQDSKSQVTPDPSVPDNGDATLAKARVVLEKVSNIYMGCSSMATLKAHADEVSKIENVENVYFSDISMFVKIKDFMTVTYSFYPKFEDTTTPNGLNQSMTRQALTRAGSTFKELGLENAAIIDQQIGRDLENIKNDVKLFFDDSGIDAKIINQPSYTFYESDVFDYDVVFILGHGNYDPVRKNHWISISSKEIFDRSQYLESAWWQQAFLSDYDWRYKGYIEDDELRFNITQENIDGKKTEFASFSISENFISSQNKKFRKNGKAIVFCISCQTLMGGDSAKPEVDNNKRDYSFAKAFINRGAGVYFGYDQTNNVGHLSGRLLFGGLASCQSVLGAYNSLPDWAIHNDQKDEERSWIADLLYYPENFDIRDNCQTHLNAPEVNETETEVVFSATEPYNLINGRGSSDDSYNYYIAQFTYGFEYSTSSEFKISKTKELAAYNVNTETSFFNRTVSYSYKIRKADLEPDTKYYYRAYMNDGTNKYYSDYKDFTFQGRIEQVVPDSIRDRMDPYIPIYEGNNPPAVEGVFLIDPAEIVYDTTNNYNAGDQGFTPIYLKFSNQSITQNTIDYEEKDVNNAGKIVSESSGPGAFISGEGDNFSVFFSTSGVSHRDTYDISYKTSLVISGTKTSSGIKDIRYAFVMVDKKNDKEHDIMDVGEFRVFKDTDGLAKTASWPSGARSWGWGYGVRNGNITTPWSMFSKKK